MADIGPSRRSRRRECGGRGGEPSAAARGATAGRTARSRSSRHRSTGRWPPFVSLPYPCRARLPFALPPDGVTAALWPGVAPVWSGLSVALSALGVDRDLVVRASVSVVSASVSGRFLALRGRFRRRLGCRGRGGPGVGWARTGVGTAVGRARIGSSARRSAASSAAGWAAGLRRALGRAVCRADVGVGRTVAGVPLAIGAGVGVAGGSAARGVGVGLEGGVGAGLTRRPGDRPDGGRPARRSMARRGRAVGTGVGPGATGGGDGVSTGPDSPSPPAPSTNVARTRFTTPRLSTSGRAGRTSRAIRTPTSDRSGARGWYTSSSAPGDVPRAKIATGT